MLRKQPGTRRVLPALALLTVMLTLVLSPQGASAAAGGCRVDPIVVLSNGLTIQVDVAIDTVAGNVNSIDYVIHGPANTYVVSISYTGAISIPEYVTYIADMNNGKISIETTVNADVRADVDVTAQAGNDSTTDRGRTNHTIKTKLRP